MPAGPDRAARPDDIVHHDTEWRRVMANIVFDPAPPAPAFP
jgi:hypothetical protein